MHIYAFGSVCRGDLTFDSDVDLLALVHGHDSRFDPNRYSIYSYAKMAVLWSRGSPFAWHLSLEAKLLYGDNGKDHLASCPKPGPYLHYVQDCEKFYRVFSQARLSLAAASSSQVFDLSTIFLSIRNIATCFSLGVLNAPDFSRHSAQHLPSSVALAFPADLYHITERARILCTRSVGPNITQDEVGRVIAGLGTVEDWMEALVRKAKEHGRV